MAIMSFSYYTLHLMSCACLLALSFNLWSRLKLKIDELSLWKYFTFLLVYPFGSILLIIVIGHAIDDRKSSEALLHYYGTEGTFLLNPTTSFITFFCVPISIMLAASGFMTGWTFGVRKVVDPDDSQMYYNTLQFNSATL